jgi:hypothetical protein
VKRRRNLLKQREVAGLVVEGIPDQDDALQRFDDGEVCAGEVASEAKDKEREPRNDAIGDGFLFHFVKYHSRRDEEPGAAMR